MFMKSHNNELREEDRRLEMYERKIFTRKKLPKYVEISTKLNTNFTTYGARRK
jgi:hypothetical protein